MLKTHFAARGQAEGEKGGEAAQLFELSSLASLFGGRAGWVLARKAARKEAQMNDG